MEPKPARDPRELFRRLKCRKDAGEADPLPLRIREDELGEIARGRELGKRLERDGGERNLDLPLRLPHGLDPDPSAGTVDLRPPKIEEVALPALAHRVVVNFAAQSEGVTSRSIVEHLLETARKWQR